MEARGCSLRVESERGSQERKRQLWRWCRPELEKKPDARGSGEVTLKLGGGELLLEWWNTA